MKTTPLTPLHQSLGARLVPFGGFEMPLSYTDITQEHRAVRTAAGIFDLSHMGRVRFRGQDAAALAGRVQTSDPATLAIGRTRYGMILNEAGGIVDDILISKEADGYLLVVNAGNRDADLAIFRRLAQGLAVEVQDDSDRLAMIAIQGPKTPEILHALGLAHALEIGYYRFGETPSKFGDLLLSRTGYTGEDGFEVLIPAENATRFFTAALEIGKSFGLEPAGLGCRDTLRLEAGMPLHGHEISTEINPYEANLGFAVRSEAPFVGKSAMEAVLAKGAQRTLVGLNVDGPHIPRQGHVVSSASDGQQIGLVCSGTFSPTLRRNIATALVSSAAASSEQFHIAIRKHVATATRVEMPFYRREQRAVRTKVAP